MDEKISEHLKMLNRYTIHPKEISKVAKNKYVSDYILRGSSERFLQLAIESCINIGNRMLTIAQFDKAVQAPETYADVFRELGKLCDIPLNLAESFVKMARFRNMLVHLYRELDPEQVYDILQGSLSDFDKFREIIIECYNKIFPEDTNDQTPL